MGGEGRRTGDAVGGWLDVDGLLDLLGPARFELVFYSEWHDSDFNWFDLVRVG